MSSAILILCCAALPAQELRSAADAPLHAVRFVDRNEGWAAGSDGVIWHTIDGGTSWERQPVPMRGDVQALQFLTPYTGYAAGREEVQANGGSAGVLLSTRDGGITWMRLAPNAVPGIHAVTFFDDRNGLVAGDGNDRWPGGVFRTADGGKTWQPVPAARGGGWRGAAFSDVNTAALAGSWGRLGVLRDGAYRPADVDPPGGRHVRAVAGTGKRAIAVGQGGLVLVSPDSGGLRYQFAELGLSPEVLSLADFRAVCCVGDHVWIVGNPGTVVFHSGDGGTTWERFHTSQTVPLNAVHFVDATHGWAVGELGTILATTDGGKSWTAQRRGGQRAAILCIHAAGRNTPLDLVATFGGDAGYLITALAVGSAETTAAPVRSSDDLRLRAAVRKSGGAAADILSGFPVPAHLAAADRDAIIAHWNTQYSGRAADRLLEQLVLAIRTWQPEVVVCDFAGAPVESIVVEAVQAAVTKAAERDALPELATTWRLPEWRVKKLYSLWDGPGTSQVTLATSDFAPGLKDAPRDYAERVVGLIAERGSLPKQRNLRLLACTLPEANARGVMDGITLAPGGTARRPAADDVGAKDESEKHHRQLKSLQAVTAVESPTSAGAALATLAPALDRVPADQAAHALLSIAGNYSRMGQWGLARETYDLAARRYEGQPAGLEALRWLVRYHSSSECRRREELKQRVSVLQTDFQASDQAPTKDNPFRGGGLKALANSSTQQHTTILSDPARAREWHQGAIECEKRLSAYGPMAQGDPAIRFSLAAARRTLGAPDGNWLRTFLAEQAGQSADDPWRVTARQELWLRERTGLSPRYAAACRKASVRPHLDAKLDDDCWNDAAAVHLKHADGNLPADDYAAQVRFAFDDEYLYLAIECKHPADAHRPKVTVRRRDMDLAAFDRVEVLLDLDRDYQSYYRFRIDQRGGLADDCCDDDKWNPRWFVACDSTPEGYAIEAAIVRSDLTGDPLPPGRSWAVNVVRVVPGKGVLAAGMPAGATPRPEGMGLLTFVDTDGALRR